MSFLETEFIRWATDGLPVRLPVGPGDDAAVLADGTVIAVDTVVEGSHFEPGTELGLVVRKALGSCLSDIAAMGAFAETVLVSAQLPPGTDGRALAVALRTWCDRFGVVLAGGDTVASPPGALALAVTATGRCPDGAAPWLRSGARPGDRLVVTGPLGGSRAGRHLRVVPRFDVVRALRQGGTSVTAALDLSDGLARDLPRMTTASGTGAEVEAGRLPVHGDAATAADPLAAALGDGEDFELLLALDPAGPIPEGCVGIGSVTEGPLVWIDLHGARCPWPDGGHEHVF